MADDQKAEPKKEEPWWIPVIGGLVLLGGSVWVYMDLTQFEASGGTRKVQWIIALLYNYLGKWGVVLFMALGGAAAIYAGVGQVMEQNAAKPEPAPLPDAGEKTRKKRMQSE
jgi:hypothetical protein